MPIWLRKLILCVIGMLAGVAAWSISEIVLWFQPLFSSYLIFNMVLGVSFGGVMGAFFGSSEGITLSLRSRAVSGTLTGILVGIIGGALAFLLGQAILFLFGELFFFSKKSFQEIGVPLSRTVSWAILGLIIGAVEGVRARSLAKLKVGLLGGLGGGILGGLALEYSKSLFFDTHYFRLLGLLVFGGLLGLFYGFVENRLSFGMLKLLNGGLKGKEYLLIQKKTALGHSKSTDIQLPDYQDVEPLHAEFKIEQKEIVLYNKSQKNPVTVNEDKIQKQILKLGDVIKIGSAKFLFRF